MNRAVNNISVKLVKRNANSCILRAISRFSFSTVKFLHCAQATHWNVLAICKSLSCEPAHSVWMSARVIHIKLDQGKRVASHSKRLLIVFFWHKAWLPCLLVYMKLRALKFEHCFTRRHEEIDDKGWRK